MPFPLSGRHPISNKDVLSYTFDSPAYDPDKPVFLDAADPSHSLSHRQAKKLVLQLIAGLHHLGLEAGDTVCLHAFNSLYYPILCLAITGAGGVFIGTNPAYTAFELTHILKIAKVRFVMAEPTTLAEMEKAMNQIGIDVAQNLLLLNANHNTSVSSPCASTEYKSWTTLLEHGERPWIRFDDEERSTNTTACLFSTSGTTGLPKCAATSHRNLVAQHQLFYETNPRSYRFSTVLSMPFFHVGILPNVLISQLREGRDAYIMPRFELKTFLSYHSKYNITEAFLVPPMVLQIVKSGLADPESPTYKYSLKTIRNAYTGAAPCSPILQKQFQRLLDEGATVSQCWGMTETTSVATMVPKHLNDATVTGQVDTYGSVGIPLPELQMKLVDTNGEDVTHTGFGELCVKGDTVVRGYFENEKATKESWDDDNYFKTGDVVRVNPETGLLYVVERVKELIKVRGFQVAPAELEAVLISHPNIADAGVIGVQVSAEEELPRAYVVRREGTAASTLTQEDVQAYVSQRLVHYKALTGGVRFLDVLPKLASGKILRRVLREMAEKEHSRIKSSL
ncbi:hypothetical protein LTS15_010479 [Exophiala xenobiotica]|nr:hypothetical protein LTS15_010479 [Exophiala xenobiotica]